MKRSVQRGEGPDYDADLYWWLLPLLAIVLVLTGAALWNPAPPAPTRPNPPLSQEFPPLPPATPDAVAQDAAADDTQDLSLSGG